MPKKKGTKDKSHSAMYWGKGWRYIAFNKMSRAIFPRFGNKRGCYNDDS